MHTAFAYKFKSRMDDHEATLLVSLGCWSAACLLHPFHTVSSTTIIFYHNAISSYTMMGRISIVFTEVTFAINPLLRVYCLVPLTPGNTLYEGTC